jgi:RNA polymerase sigma-70 factor, ECF subfamily
MDAPCQPARLSSIAVLTNGLAMRGEEAFRQFHAEYFDRLFRYQLVLAHGDEDIARDALQETLLRVVRHARRFDDEQTFWSWLTVLARSAAVDGGRKRHRYWRMLAGYARLLVGPTLRPDGSNDDLDHLDELLDRSLEELDPDGRVLTEAKCFRRTSVRELAARTGRTERAVESRLARARHELRKSILKKLHHENAA